MIAIANRLTDNLSNEGIVARIGGDEFAILITPFDPKQVEAWAKRIFNLFTKPILSCGNPILVSNSMGIVVFANEISVDIILGNASTALHYAKTIGKKTWKLFENEMQEAVVMRIQMESELYRDFWH